ncbi:MAG TPA: hypothetical protein VEK33_06895 [Terriglobales bacterium]|nr:hypothetical protein [Terriglobales bacterium]
MLDGCAGITMLDNPLVTVPLGMAGDAAGIGLPSPEGVAMTGSATSGLMLRAGTLAWSDPVRTSSGGIETGGSTSGVGATADTISIADPAAGSNLSSTGEGEEILVDGCAGTTLVAIPFAAVPFAGSGDEAGIGLPSPDGVAKTGFATSGLMLRVGTLAWSDTVRNSSGGTEADGSTSGAAATADAIPIAEPAGSNLAAAGKAEPNASPTGGSGAGGRKAGKGGVSKILPFLSGITPAAGAGVSGVGLAEEVGDFVGFFGFHFVTLPRSISPVAFAGFSEISFASLVASAKAVENVADGATPPTDTFASITFTATGGKLTITISPQPHPESARRWPEWSD